MAKLIMWNLTTLDGFVENPIILGGGTPLFKQGERVKLRLLDTRALSTGIVILRYAPTT
jgi:dihydrofolate reductase